MSPTFTDDDIGKTVESADGEPLGAVVAVDAETAYVDPEPGLADSVRAVLEWDGSADDAVPLGDDAVDRITEDAIRLDAAFPDESVTTGDESDRAETGDRTESTETDRQDIGQAPGEPVESNTTETAADVDGTDRGLGTGRPDESESLADDEYYDTREGGARVDSEAEMDEYEPEEATGPNAGEEADVAERTARRTKTADTDADADADADANSDVDVDPSDVTDGDPEADIRTGEDVGQRTDAPGASAPADATEGESDTTDADERNREED